MRHKGLYSAFPVTMYRLWSLYHLKESWSRWENYQNTLQCANKLGMRFCVLEWFSFCMQLFFTSIYMIRTKKSTANPQRNLYDLVWICHCRFTCQNSVDFLVQIISISVPCGLALKRPVTPTGMSVFVNTCISHNILILELFFAL